LTTIPRAYWGEFSLDRKVCGDDDSNDESRIWVEARRISMYEASRKVAEVSATKQGLRLRFAPWERRYYEAGFNPEEGLTPPDELVPSRGGEVLNGAYRRCHVKRK
jgi:hypothetical protein